MTSLKFSGNVSIEISIKEEIKQIRLNSAELEIHSAKIGTNQAQIQLDEVRLSLYFMPLD